MQLTTCCRLLVVVVQITPLFEFEYFAYLLSFAVRCSSLVEKTIPSFTAFPAKSQARRTRRQVKKKWRRRRRRIPIANSNSNSNSSHLISLITMEIPLSSSFARLPLRLASELKRGIRVFGRARQTHPTSGRRFLSSSQRTRLCHAPADPPSRRARSSRPRRLRLVVNTLPASSSRDREALGENRPDEEEAST